MRPPYGRSAVISVVLLLAGVCFFAPSRSGAAETTTVTLCLLRISFFLIVLAPIFMVDLLACLVIFWVFDDDEWIEIGVPILSGIAMLPWGFMVGKMTASLLTQEVPNQLISPGGGLILAICIVVLVFAGRNTRNDSLAE